MIEALETRIAPANILWTGSTDSLWSHAGNWVDAATFSAATIAPGDTLFFDDSGAFNTLINDTAPSTPYALVFTAISHPYTLAGNAITLPNGGGVGHYGPAPVTIGLSLSGPGAVLQTSGVLTLDAVNTFSGGVSVSGGVMRISGAASLGTGDVTLTGGVFEPLASSTIPNDFHLGPATFAISTGTTATLSGTITDATAAGALNKTGAGTLVLANSGNTFTGNVGINSGIVRVTASATTVNPDASALGDPQIARTIAVGAGSILEFAASNVFGIDGSTPNVALAIQGTVTNTAGKFNTLGPVHLDVTGVLTGLGGLSSTKQMYSLKGDVTGNGGVISGTGSNAGYHIGAGVSFGTNTAPLTINAVLLDQTAGVGTAPSPLVIEGSGTVVLTKVNRFSGGVFVESGKLAIATNGNLGAVTNGVSILDGGTLVATASITTPRAVTLSGFATIHVGLSTALLTLTGTVGNSVGFAPGLLHVTGPGKLVLGNSGNSFSGGTSIDGGTVRISLDENLGSSAGDVTMSNGGKLEVTTNLTTPRDFTIGGIARFGIPSGKVLTISGIVQDATIPGQISVSGGGTIVLSNSANTFTGPYTISGGFLTLGGVKTRISGPGSATIVPLGSGGIESIVLTGTTLASKLVLTSSIDQGAPTLPVYRISIPAATDHINSIDLRKGKLLFGDGNVNTDADLFIAGKSKSLFFQDVNTGAILKLGAGLPYDVVGDEITPDTYNNKPNITIRDILGEDARIDVTGDRTEGGVGGGGLGKVRIHSWRPTSSGGGTGPVPSPNLGATEPPAYGIIETTQTIDLIEIQDGDAEIDVFADADEVGVATVANVLEIKCTNGDWKSKSSKIEGKLGKFTVKDFSGTIDVGGDVGEDDGFTIKSFTVTGKFSGELIGGTVISVKAGNFTGTALKKARITATTSIGDIATTNGNMDYTIVQSLGNIGNISLVGSGLGKLKNSMILSGTYLGDDGLVGGDIDTFVGGTSIGNITLVGDMTASVIAASISPNAGGYDGPFVPGNADTSYLGGGTIGTVKLLTAALASSAVASSGSYTNLIMAKTIANIIENKSGGISKLASASELTATGTARLYTTNSLLVASVL